MPLRETMPTLPGVYTEVEPGMMPTLHCPGVITMQANETVYLAEGAVVYGVITATHADNITIRGRGYRFVSDLGAAQAARQVASAGRAAP